LIPIEEEKTFLFQADIKTLASDLHISIVGFGEICGERRPVYRALSIYKADKGDWRQIRRIFCPGCRNYKVKFLQISFSIPKGSGKIYIDNVILKPVPESPNDQTEETARSFASDSDTPIA
jgi:hypothetical protein